MSARQTPITPARILFEFTFDLSKCQPLHRLYTDFPAPDLREVVYT